MVRRGGFGIVEVVVAMTLIGVGVMSVMAGAAFSTRLLRLAENEEDASRIAAAVIDSLMFVDTPASGARNVGRFAVRWEAGSESGVLRLFVASAELPEAIVIVETAVAPRLAQWPPGVTAESGGR